MDFIHFEVDLGASRKVIVGLRNQARVMLLDSFNFEQYRNRRGFRYIGGWAIKSPIPLQAPHAGRWHVVVDLNGASGPVHATVQVA